MSNYINMDTLRFHLFDVHKINDLFSKERYTDYDEESIGMFVDAVKDFSDQDLFPIFRDMDRSPAYWKDGKIIVHPKVKDLMIKGAELGLIGGDFDFEHGGMQIPAMAAQAAYFVMSAANNNCTGYPGLTAGAAELIAHFGSEELREKYTPKMLTGEWGGTMCLTEPQAGSSLSDITTSATPLADGSYDIKGQKIFISGGDHEYADNFVHLVLARIDGAPAGTKGISLFVVPKKLVHDDGSMEDNDVYTAGDFQKMGQRGYCTTHLVFGENKESKGWLVGEAHKGLKYMFLMMNGARIAVGRDGAAVACAAYHASLQYAKERPQGRKLTQTGAKNAAEPQTLIINHADVRRMLLLQKAIYEGSLSLIMEASKQYDIIKSSEGEEKDRANLFLEIIIPIVKTYPAEKGRQAVDNGVQILGGYGFCEDFVLQQYLRDIRIMAIYEGTTGIQSLDLLGRKIPMKGGKALSILVEEMTETINAAMTFDELKPLAAELGKQMKTTEKVLGFLMPHAMQGNHERYLSDATIFMEMFGTIVIGWQWLKLAANAKQAMVTGNKKFSDEFYESQVHTARFYYKYEMSRTRGMANIIMHDDELTIMKEKELAF